MCSLVDGIKSIPGNRICNAVSIQHLYAFALNRRNSTGDRENALCVIHQVLCSDIEYYVDGQNVVLANE